MAKHDYAVRGHDWRESVNSLKELEGKGLPKQKQGGESPFRGLRTFWAFPPCSPGMRDMGRCPQPPCLPSLTTPLASTPFRSLLSSMALPPQPELSQTPVMASSEPPALGLSGLRLSTEMPLPSVLECREVGPLGDGLSVMGDGQGDCVLCSCAVRVVAALLSSMAAGSHDGLVSDVAVPVRSVTDSNLRAERANRKISLAP